MLLPSCRIGSSCWTRKNGARTLTAKSSVEILDRRVLDRRCLRDAGVGDKDIEPIADDVARPLRQLVRPVRRREIGADGVGAAAGLANLRDDGFGFLRAAAVMDENLRAGLGERQRAGAADAARGAGDESGFSLRAWS